MARKRPALKTTGDQQKRKAPPHAFKPGQSGNPAGRRPGIPNRATLEAKAFFAHLLTDEVYTKNLLKRLRDGTCAPAVETMAFYFVCGKPKERIEFGADKTLADLVKEAVLLRAADLPKG